MFSTSIQQPELPVIATTNRNKNSDWIISRVAQVFQPQYQPFDAPSSMRRYNE
jgi:hypothetical protein